MRIAYVGNFLPAHSTENHVARELVTLGHDVWPIQENVPPVPYAELGDLIPARADLLLWTRTWDVDHDGQLTMLDRLRRAGVPTVGFHLDRYVGLDREPQIRSLPWWRCDLMVTADGDTDSQRLFESLGVRHVWSPPAVVSDECYLADPDPTVAADVAFIGSWRRYHREWPWRRQLVLALRSRYRRRLRLWGDGGPPVRGHRLNQVLASTKVVVGDSCFSDTADGYLSDRVFETLGRGGFLLHPDTPGLRRLGLEPGVHLGTFRPCDVDDLCAQVDRWLADPEGREEVRRRGHLLVRREHTYRHRLARVLDRVWVPT